MHFECPSCDKEDVVNWQATSSKALAEPPKEVLPPDQAQIAETATEAEELPIGAPEQGD